MVSVAKPWLICGYKINHGLTIVTMFFFFGLICSKTMVIFVRDIEITGFHRWKFAER